MSESEADTCRRYITPALLVAGWDPHVQIAEQRPVTDGRVVVAGRTTARRRPRRLDYLLRFTRDLPLAVLEAKAQSEPAASGLQQAIEYAEMLGLPFAYASNGVEIIEHDFLTGVERTIDAYPSPDELWLRYCENRDLPVGAQQILAEPLYQDPERSLRYYQLLSVNRAVEAFALGRERALLTLATGTGKSFVAFQICWRLWNSQWNRAGANRRPRILYIADRNVLLDQPRLGVFAPFGDAIHKVDADAVLSRQVYFATYQQLAKDERRPGLYKNFPSDFFDLVIVDECHRGSAADDSNWREILEYFTSAAKLGMTATPLRQDNRDTYSYFGAPLFEYSLAQGIEDGFLAPYMVHRFISDVDALGYRPAAQQLDRHGNAIPDRNYVTADFERTLVLPQRTMAMARRITEFLDRDDPYAKSIVFCVDQDHALLMRNCLVQINSERVRENPDYVCRVTSDEGDFGRLHLDNFQDIDRRTPVVLTSSDMLTTGVDAPTLRNVIICRAIRSMSTFKQIIGRGTRLRTDYGKWYFNILDFTGAATSLFADPAFDGLPEAVFEDGDVVGGDEASDSAPDAIEGRRDPYQRLLDAEADGPIRKYYLDDVAVEIVAGVVYRLDDSGRRLTAQSYQEYAGEQVRSVCADPEVLHERWTRQTLRRDLATELQDRGIDLADLAQESGYADADVFDILLHVAFGAQPLSRSARAAKIRDNQDFWAPYPEAAQRILRAVLDKYERFGHDELTLPDALQVPPLSAEGNIVELASRFGGPQELRRAFGDMEQALYSA